MRGGQSLRSAAEELGFSLASASYWVERAKGQRLERADLANRKPGRASNRTTAQMEQRIVSVRQDLREHSVLGEYGLDAIAAALRVQGLGSEVPSRTTLYRVLERHGIFDAKHRQRRPAPPKGWYLPNVAGGQAELDSFDFIEDLKIAAGPLVSVLTAISLHAGFADAWIVQQAAKSAAQSLLLRWREHGLPAYAQFDNGTPFQGAHQFPDTVGRVSRLCLALGVIPVFAPPREPGFQNAIESFNALWQAKVWQRHHCADVDHLIEVSTRYIAAHRARSAVRRENAPPRRPFPEDFRLDLNTALQGTMIFLRRSDEAGRVQLLGRSFQVTSEWVHRLVRCEVDFTLRSIRFYALRRRHPDEQPLLREAPYQRPNKPFQGSI